MSERPRHTLASLRSDDAPTSDTEEQLMESIAPSTPNAETGQGYDPEEKRFLARLLGEEFPDDDTEAKTREHDDASSGTAPPRATAASAAAASDGDDVQVTLKSGESFSGAGIVRQRVVCNGRRTGTVRFCGGTKFSDGVWVGVELDEQKGKNNGSVGGTVYFSCGNQYGLFLRSAQVELLEDDEEDGIASGIAGRRRSGSFGGRRGKGGKGKGKGGKKPSPEQGGGGGGSGGGRRSGGGGGGAGGRDAARAGRYQVNEGAEVPSGASSSESSSSQGGNKRGGRGGRSGRAGSRGAGGGGKRSSGGGRAARAQAGRMGVGADVVDLSRGAGGEDDDDDDLAVDLDLAAALAASIGGGGGSGYGGSDAPAPRVDWSCDRCTLLNAAADNVCVACNASRPTPPPSPSRPRGGASGRAAGRAAYRAGRGGGSGNSGGGGSGGSGGGGGGGGGKGGGVGRGFVPGSVRGVPTRGGAAADHGAALLASQADARRAARAARAAKRRLKAARQQMMAMESHEATLDAMRESVFLAAVRYPYYGPF